MGMEYVIIQIAFAMKDMLLLKTAVAVTNKKRN